MFGDTPGRLFVSTERDLWTSGDNGETEVCSLWFEELVISHDEGRRGRDSLLMVTEHEVLAMPCRSLVPKFPLGVG